jgi:hypothetical protein
MGEVGKGISAFRKGISDASAEAAAAAEPPAIQQAPEPARDTRPS